MVSPLATTEIDLDWLRAKYAHERDRRMRRDGQAQYIEQSGAFAHHADDPHGDPAFTREPLNDTVEVLIVGGGFSGMVTAARLVEAGVTDIRIVETGADFGGTWYWNRYPGAQCDIDAYCYLPLLEETGYVPREKYAYQTEIYEHVQRLARHFELRRFACFQTTVTAMEWDADGSCWQVETDREDRFAARFVVLCAGVATRPKLPGIPGIETFTGHTFHTCRWDYDYTGGDTHGDLHKLADKRVAIIGTGATAVQCVPHLGRDSRQLYVFQRTPSTVDLRNNKPTDPAWAASLQPGWQRARQENFDTATIGLPVEEDLVNDGWTDAARFANALNVTTTETAEAALIAELADAAKMNELRARINATVEDPAVAEALKPWYRRHCKRPTFNDDYLPTFNRPNVTLVDTSGSHGVERITPTGVVANGVEHEVDCIIFATGFEITTSFERRYPISMRGIDGTTVLDYWSDGMRTFHGWGASAFPNWLFVGYSQNGLSPNYMSMLGDQSLHVAYIISEVRRRGHRVVRPTVEAEAEWVGTIHATGEEISALFSECTPGTLNNEGQLEEAKGPSIGQIFAPGVIAYNAIIAEWREHGDLAGLELV